MAGWEDTSTNCAFSLTGGLKKVISDSTIQLSWPDHVDGVGDES